MTVRARLLAEAADVTEGTHLDRIGIVVIERAAAQFIATLLASEETARCRLVEAAEMVSTFLSPSGVEVVRSEAVWRWPAGQAQLVLATWPAVRVLKIRPYFKVLLAAPPCISGD